MAYKQKSEDLKNITNAVGNRVSYTKPAPGPGDKDDEDDEDDDSKDNSDGHVKLENTGIKVNEVNKAKGGTSPYVPRAVAVLKATPGGMERMAAAYTKQSGSTLYEGPQYQAFLNYYATDVHGK
jgi:hypothetical protein